MITVKDIHLLGLEAEERSMKQEAAGGEAKYLHLNKTQSYSNTPSAAVGRFNDIPKKKEIQKHDTSLAGNTTKKG